MCPLPPQILHVRNSPHSDCNVDSMRGAKKFRSSQLNVYDSSSRYRRNRDIAKDLVGDAKEHNAKKVGGSFASGRCESWEKASHGGCANRNFSPDALGVM